MGALGIHVLFALELSNKEDNKMKIPNIIKVGGHKISVELTDTSRIGGAGSFNNYHNLIRLEKETDTPEDNVAETFLHEIIEAIKHKNNLGIEHTVLTVLSEALFQTIRDNDLDFRKPLKEYTEDFRSRLTAEGKGVYDE